MCLYHGSCQDTQAMVQCHAEYVTWPGDTCRCVKTVVGLPQQLLKALSHSFKVSHIGVDLDPEGGAGLGGVGQGTCQTDGDCPVIPTHNLC